MFKYCLAEQSQGTNSQRNEVLFQDPVRILSDLTKTGDCGFLDRELRQRIPNTLTKNEGTEALEKTQIC